tara:strand:+ start:109 stop:339 length:231 start_codon:yes stop_codon:yes gene_type:complete
MKVGNRLKQGTRDQRIQDRHARLVAQVNQLQDDNARLQKQVDSNKAAFDWARCQAHINRLIADRNQLRAQLAALTS